MKPAAVRLLIVATLTFAILRLTLPQPGVDLRATFKDVAHIYVGMLAVLAWQNQPYCRWMFWGICAVEVFAAIPK